jgi:hypothetical protein
MLKELLEKLSDIQKKLAIVSEKEIKALIDKMAGLDAKTKESIMKLMK